MIVIVDYGVGNLGSIKNMFNRIGKDCVISKNAEEIQLAEKLILPGIGNFDHCMKSLNLSGLRESIERCVMIDKKPVLGICVGLQMMMSESEEGQESGLSWIGGKTVGFHKELLDAGLKIPNIGWHEVKIIKPSKLFGESIDKLRYYFAHSYYVVPDDERDILLTAEYGYKFVAAIERENIMGVQFHPEKSHRFGLTLFKNFTKV